MCLVEKEAQLGLVGIANFGERFKQLGEQPEQKGRIELWRGHQLVSGKNVDHPAPAVVELDEVHHVERGLAEEMLATLATQLE